MDGNSNKRLSIEGVRHAHFIGVGGCGMSAAAHIMLERGIGVSGSDQSAGAATRSLVAKGARIAFGHAPENIPPETDLVVVTAAVSESNPERMEAEARGLTIAKYATVLGALMDTSRGIAIAGTHGKTTTTAMVATVLAVAGLEPSYVIGGMVDDLKGNAHAGAGDFFVAEACEYDRSFLNLRPEAAVITNIELDHIDCYRDLDEIMATFRLFLGGLRPGGVAVIHESLYADLCDAVGVDVRLRTFGCSPESDYWIRTIRPAPGGAYSFKLTVPAGRPPLEIQLQVPGTHNVLDAGAAAAILLCLGVEPADIEKGLARFRGVQRRFQRKGQVAGVSVVDDYAHHPTEVRAVLDTARSSYPGRRIWAVFQPHQASRTKAFLDDFAVALGEADRVVVSEIYLSRETEQARCVVSSGELVERVGKLGGNAVAISSLNDVLAYLRGQIRPGDVVLTMGAGDVYNVSDELLATEVSDCRAK